MNNLKNKIVVIGAGLAGLTVAYRLFQKKYPVEVYEARSRVGGRVHSIFIKNRDGDHAIAELGGQNMTDGGEASQLRSLCKELSLELMGDEFEFDSAFYDGKIFHEKQDLFSKLRWNEQTLSKKLAELGKSSQSMRQVLTKIVDDPLLQRFFSFLLNAYEGLPPEKLSAQPHNLKTLESMLLGGLSQAHQAIDQKAVLHRLFLKNGNATLPMKLAEIMKDSIHLKKALKKAEMVNEKIMLTMSDSTIVECDKLILAIPCSVYEDIIFDDKLINQERLNLIQTRLYGTNAKVFVPMDYYKSTKGHFFTDEMVASLNTNQLLMMYFVNDNNVELKQDHYEKILMPIKARFQNIIFNEGLPSEVVDENFIKYDSPVAKWWVKDKYAKGSFSAYDLNIQDKIDKSVNYRGIMVRELFAPIHDCIFFVGEHATLLDEIGTMAAAVESGERIAKLFTKR